MPTLLIRLAGPLQSWGTSSRFAERDTGLEPSKSGVVGLLAAALGRDRHLEINDIASLRMGVRVDREGILKRDYQTAGNIIQANGTMNSDLNMRNAVSVRYFLAGAHFLVGLEGDGPFLTRLYEAVRTPHWPLALGRKAFVPSPGVFLPDGLSSSPLEQALSEYPRQFKKPIELRLLIEDREGAFVRNDQPLGPFATRSFGPRRYRVEYVAPMAEAPLTEVPLTEERG